MRALEVTPWQTHILRLERDEDVFVTLVDFCEKRAIQAAFFSAIGAVKDAKLGFYNLEQKEYGSFQYPDEREVASMTGNISIVDGKPFIHVHAALSGIKKGDENQCVGGHVFAATVAVTLEIYLVVFKEPLTRSPDEIVGLKLLDCPLL